MDKIKILVVDDESRMRKLVRDFLIRDNFEVVEMCIRDSLYPCHQFVGNEKFLMGNVTDGVTNTAIRDEFKSCNVYAKEKCRNCFARFYCSGGCAANSYNFHGDIHNAYDIGCALQDVYKRQKIYNVWIWRFNRNLKKEPEKNCFHRGNRCTYLRGSFPFISK